MLSRNFSSNDRGGFGYKVNGKLVSWSIVELPNFVSAESTKRRLAGWLKGSLKFGRGPSSKLVFIRGASEIFDESCGNN